MSEKVPEQRKMDPAVNIRWIQSSSNAYVKQARALRMAKHRLNTGLYPIEGVRLLEDAVAAKAPLCFALVSPRLFDSRRGILLGRALSGSNIELLGISNHMMAALHETRTHQGVLAIARRTVVPLSSLPGTSASILVVAHRIQDPGNLGAIIRVSDAAGSDGVVTTRETVDPFNPKTVRTTMGSIFRQPVVAGEPLDIVARWCRENGLRILGAHLDGTPINEVDLTTPFALVVGREGEGIPREDTAILDQRIRIPMRARVDSLNVGSAVAVILYERARQLGYEFGRPFDGHRFDVSP